MGKFIDDLISFLEAHNLRTESWEERTTLVRGKVRQEEKEKKRSLRQERKERKERKKRKKEKKKRKEQKRKETNNEDKKDEKAKTEDHDDIKFIDDLISFLEAHNLRTES